MDGLAASHTKGGWLLRVQPRFFTRQVRGQNSRYHRVAMGTIQINLRVSQQLLEQIDEMRGLIPRNPFIVDVLKRGMPGAGVDQPPKKASGAVKPDAKGAEDMFRGRSSAAVKRRPAVPKRGSP